MTKPNWRLARLAPVAAAAFWALACQEETPTSIDSGLVPVSPITLDIELPFDSFARGVAVYGGFGQNNVAVLGSVTGYAALGFGDDQLEARTLSRFGALPESTVIQDTTGASVTETDLAFLDGFVTILVDTLTTISDSVSITAEAMDEAWDASTASWTAAADSAGSPRAWTIDGGGSTTAVGTVTWARGAATLDTIRIPVDSATVAAWADTSDATRGLLLRSNTNSSNVAFLGVSLSVNARPASNPDTMVALAVPLTAQTFIYNPPPTPDSTELWVGGSPAWRSVFTIDLPTQLNGPASLCAVVSCPVDLTEDLVTSALLTLTTAPVSTSFVPADSLTFDARPVLAPERLPQAPLGGTLSFLPVSLPPVYFTSQVGTEVNVPITSFVQLLVAGEDDEGREPPSTVALVSTLEPGQLGFGAFQGAGQDGAPSIRLVLTIPESSGN